jgi:hypothetical protein
MEFKIKRAILILSIAAFCVGEHSAVAGNPIGDFFKRLGDSIAHPRSTPAPRRKLQKSTTGKKRDDNSPATPQDAPPEVSVPPTPTPTPMRIPMPVPQVVRAADGVPPSKSQRRDLPYGIPVPNKTGFVTSPYAPKSGYVDVRGFPSGTEVKDPYTGKTFLTP